MNPKIRLAQSTEASKIFDLLMLVKEHLFQLGIFQWTPVYPNLKVVQDDLNSKTLYALDVDNEIAGVITINEFQDEEYKKINWQFDDQKALVVHRLAISPTHQKKGLAKILMNFAEDFAVRYNYSSIRLDAYTKNPRALKFYKNRNYQIRGTVDFPGRHSPFYCYEKKIYAVFKD